MGSATKTVRLTVGMEASLREGLREAAFKRDTTIGAVIRQAISEFLARESEDAKAGSAA